MKVVKLYLTFNVFLCAFTTNAQTPVFEIVSGSTVKNQPGVYGSLWTGSTQNTPGSRDGSISWTDPSGDLWLYGGWGREDVYGEMGYLNDLWRFDPGTNEWTWIAGSNTPQSGYWTINNATSELIWITQAGPEDPIYSGPLCYAYEYGTPGGREESISWIDSSGNLWFFGGYFYFGYDGLWNFNDLWKFNTGTKTWTLVSGKDHHDDRGTYGSKGVGSVNNIPPARCESISWAEDTGNFWLFGGGSYEYNGMNPFNDLWKYEPTSNEWTWVSGSNEQYQKGSYGTISVASIHNIPGARYGGISWQDISGNFWLFGGEGFDKDGSDGTLNDLWKYNPNTNEWAWMSGSSVVDQKGTYGTQGVGSVYNIPGARRNAISWIDEAGNLWLSGGSGYDSNGDSGSLNDLWRFKPGTREWTWVAGSNQINQGIQTDMPGSRRKSISWSSNAREFWLFGGYGIDENNSSGWLNDFWKWNPDLTQPSVSISSQEVVTTNRNPFEITITFSEEVTGFSEASVNVTNGSFESVSSDDSISYVVTIAPAGDGPIIIEVPADAVSDYAGNGNLGSNQFSILYDSTPPSVTITSDDPDPTNSNTVLLLVKFSEEVSGLDQGDLDIENASIQTITTADNITYQVQIVPIEDGIVTVSIPAGITSDLSGNYNLEEDFTINYDSTLPTVVITSNYPDQTNDNPFNIYVTFSERVTGFDHTDLVVNNGISENVLTNDFTRFVVPIIPSSEGEITVLVPSDISTDMAGNSNMASNDFLITYDSTPPTAIISTIENDPTNSGTFSVDIVFSEMVAGFEHSDLEVINGTAGTELTNDNISFSVPISPISDGSVTINLPANRAADIAGNGNSASNEISLNFDSTSPSVVITSNEADPTENNPFDIEITFSEVVNGFDVNDLSITNGTAGNLSTVDNIAYSGSITPIDEGLITIAIPENVATDDAGNGNTEAEDFTITYELPNNNPTIVDQSFSVDENSENGTLVGSIVASDEDGDELAFIIEEGNIGNAFAINGTTGELTVNASNALDFETNPEFLLAVKIFDGNGGTATAIITINLNDIDETPVTGLDDPGRTNIKLYPNPFGNQIIVESSVFNTNNYDLKLYDPVGKLIPIYYTRVKEDVIKIDLPNLKPGMYFLSIKINDEAGIMSVIKQ